MIFHHARHPTVWIISWGYILIDDIPRPSITSFLVTRFVNNFDLSKLALREIKTKSRNHHFQRNEIQIGRGDLPDNGRGGDPFKVLGSHHAQAKSLFPLYTTIQSKFREKTYKPSSFDYMFECNGYSACYRSHVIGNLQY